MVAPKIQLEEVPCPLCDVDSHTVAARQRDFVHQVDPEHLWSLKACRPCRHFYLSPRPTPESITAFYAAEYSYHTLKPLRRWARHLLRRAVQQAYVPDEAPCGFSYYPRRSVLLRGLGTLLVPVLARRGLSGVCSVLMTPESYGIAFRPRMRFLDIGCGTGWDAHLTVPALALRALVRTGVHCVGIEPSAACRALLEAEGIRSYGSVAECLRAGETPFEVIRLNWCVEHVHDPVALFRGVRGLSAEGAKVLVTVPNYDGLAYRLAPECIEVPLHLQYFTPVSLKKLGAVTGFRVERMIAFSTPGVLAYAIALQEGMTPDRVLGTQRKRIVRLMGEAVRSGAGDELFCLMAPSS